MEFARTEEAREISSLNSDRNLVVGERYKVRRSGGVEDGWQLMMFGPSGKLVLAKTASTTANCSFLR